jgi:hypothetical protein
MKRLLPLLIVVAAFLAAPAAMARECYRCKIRSLPHTEPPQCKVVTVGPRFFECYEDFELDECVLTGSGCTELAAAAPVTLASEFTVASVERLDDAQAAANTALVASLRTTR